MTSPLPYGTEKLAIGSRPMYIPGLMQLNKKEFLQQIHQALDLIEKEHYPEALAILRPLAAVGSAEAKFQIGRLYHHGQGVDRAEALAMFSEAAELDHPEACFRYAFLADSVRGGGIYTSEGKALLEKAGRLGSIDAQRILGVHYATGDWGSQGKIAEKDEAQARYWYQKAAENGDQDSQYDLGLMLLDGEGGPADIPAGLNLLNSLEHHWLAKRVLVEMHRYGHYGVPINLKKAEEIELLPEIDSPVYGIRFVKNL